MTQVKKLDFSGSSIYCGVDVSSLLFEFLHTVEGFMFSNNFCAIV
jgi:hypothetical protein